MTSQRQISANRRNATRSTGPRSATGKRRASQNAFQHGLATSFVYVPAISIEIERLARAILGTSQSFMLHYARTAAEAQFQILQVRDARVALINEIAMDRGAFRPRKENLVGEKLLKSRHPNYPEYEIVARAFAKASHQLAAYDRYELRALLRRRRALRELGAAREMSPPSLER